MTVVVILFFSGVLWYRFIGLGVGVIIIRLARHILIAMLRK